MNCYKVQYNSFTKELLKIEPTKHSVVKNLTISVDLDLIEIIIDIDEDQKTYSELKSAIIQYLRDDKIDNILK
jgi:hypothetical protein